MRGTRTCLVCCLNEVFVVIASHHAVHIVCNSRVHLAVRSEHFRAMLFGGMRESGAKTEIPLPVCQHTQCPSRLVTIGSLTRVLLLLLLQDVSYPVFMKMLEFLYTDEVGDIAADLAIPLLIASERYLLDRLKGLCEDAIRKSITSTNVVSIFMAAHRHRAADLKVRTPSRLYFWSCVCFVSSTVRCAPHTAAFVSV